MYSYMECEITETRQDVMDIRSIEMLLLRSAMLGNLDAITTVTKALSVYELKQIRKDVYENILLSILPRQANDGAEKAVREIIGQVSELYSPKFVEMIIAKNARASV